MKKVLFVILTLLLAAQFTAQEKLINGNFDDGVTGWNLEISNDAVATVAADNGAAKVSITSSTGTNWHIQFAQPITMVKDAKYIITYKARASEATKMETWIQEAHDPYGGFMQKTVNLTTEMVAFADTIVADRSDDVVKFTFFIGNSGNVDIWFDDVSVIEKTPNMLTNGDFEAGTTAWNLEVNDVAAATFEIDSVNAVSGKKSAHVVITANTSTTWHIQLGQPFPVLKDKIYIISFKAKGSKAISMGTWIQQNHDPYGNIYAGTFDVTTEWKSFIDSGAVYEDDDGKWAFTLGNQGTGEFWFDDVVIIEKNKPAVQDDVVKIDVVGTEKIINGLFETEMSPWVTELQQGGAATLDLDANNPMQGTQSAHVKITNSTGTDWHIQFKQQLNMVKEGSQYFILFKARASETVNVQYSIQQYHDPYSFLSSKVATITTEPQIFMDTSAVLDAEDNNVKFTFMLGQLANNVELWFDNVTIIETASVGNLDIVIDAEKDAWYDGLTSPNNGMIYLPAKSYLRDVGTAPASDEDLSGIFWSAWDNNYFYYYAEIVDDIIAVDNATTWQNDGIEVKYDPDPSIIATTGAIQTRVTAYDEDDAQDPAGVDNINGDGQLQDVDGNVWEPTWDDYARKETDNGYVLEWRVPLAYVNTTTRILKPGVGGVYGMAINLADNDGVERAHMLQWSAGHADVAWANPQKHGKVTMMEDNKLKYEAINAQDPSVVNDSAAVWYYGGVTSVNPNQISTVPSTFNLDQNYPNPFNPSTIINYSLDKQDKVTLAVYSITGEKVKDLIVDQNQRAGTYQVVWNGTNNKGASVSSGIYLYQLIQGKKLMTKKMMLIR